MFAKRYIVLTDEIMSLYKNQGGYDLLRRSVDQIRSKKQLAAATDTCTALDLDGLVMVGSGYTLTDAAYLAEHLTKHQRRDTVSFIGRRHRAAGNPSPLTYPPAACVRACSAAPAHAGDRDPGIHRR